jgi:hypothetical protein
MRLDYVPVKAMSIKFVRIIIPNVRRNS